MEISTGKSPINTERLNVAPRAAWYPVLPTRAVLSFLSLLIMLSGFVPAIAYSMEKTPIAELDRVRGSVLVRNAGEALWERADNGTRLLAGDEVKSRGGSSAVIQFKDGGFFKLMPLTRVQLDHVTEDTGLLSNVISLKMGKLWIKVDASPNVERTLVEVAGAVMDADEGAVFIETDSSGGRACVDVFSGNAAIRKLDDPGKVSKIEPNKRIAIDKDEGSLEPVGFSDAFNVDNEQYSCLVDAEKKKSDTANIAFSVEENDGEYFVLIRGRAQIVFKGEAVVAETVVDIPDVQFEETSLGEEFEIVVARTATITFDPGETTAEVSVTDDEGLLVFTPESCVATGYECTSDVDCCAGSCNNDVCSSEQEVVYKTITVSAQSTVSFACEAKLGVNDVKVDGVSVSDGATIQIDGAECEKTKSVSANWSVTSCAGHASALKAYNPDGSAQSVESGSPFQIALEPSLVEIEATDSFGEKVTFSFKVQLKGHESLTAAPTVTSVSYAGETIADGGSVSATIDSCEEGSFTTSGTAESKCWDISSVKFTQDGEQLSADGFKSWSAITNVAAVEKTSVFEVRVTDSTGVESEALSFSMKFSVAEELLEPPTITNVTYGDNAVSAGDSVSVAFDACEAQSVTISGEAKTPCGTITAIDVTKGDTTPYANGLAEWSLTDNPSTTDKLTEISVTATNSSGKKSEAFKFSVEPGLSISAPEVTLETIANTTIEDLYTAINLNKDDLQGGTLKLSGTAESDSCSVTKIEVSLDEGGTWSEAVGTESWSYEFTPQEGTYYLQARAFDNVGNASEADSALEVIYKATSNEDILFDIFDKLIQAYLDKDRTAFVDLTSPDFTSDYDSIDDVSQLEASLDNKFVANDVVYLKYNVETITVTGDVGRVGFSWESDSGESGYSHYGIFQFAKEDDSWRFYTLEDDNTFLRYTSVVASIDLTSDDDDLVADEEDSTEIEAEVRDSANNLISDGTVISFFTYLGSITASAETINGVAKATFTAGAYTGDAKIYATSGVAKSNTVTIELHPESAPCPPGVICD